MILPVADCLNHKYKTEFSSNLLEKNLHKSMNKIYMYRHNFDKKGDQEDDDSMYDKTSSKLRVACKKLFSEDEIAELP